MIKTRDNGLLHCILKTVVTGVLICSRPVLGDGWEEVTPTGEKPGALCGHSMIKLDNDIYIFGGAGGSGVELNDLWAFNRDNQEWVKKAPANNPPPPRKNHCAFEYQGSLVITAGDQAGVPVALAFHKYDPLENTWVTIHPAGETLPEPRTEAAMTVAGDKAYLQGGRNPATGTIFRDLWVVYLNTFTTEKLADLGEYEGPRYGHQSVTMGSDVLIGGGNGSPWGYHSGNLVYHTDGGTWDIVDWKPKAGMAWFNQVMLRMYSTMLYRSLSIFLFGGQCPQEHPFGDFPKVNTSSVAGEDTILCDMWRLDTADSTVTRCADLPVALARAAGVVLDGGFYIFGGMKADGTAGSALYRYVEEDTPVEKTGSQPAVFHLHPSYPNPFNPGTTIRYTLHQAGHVRLQVFDIRGRQVRMLADEYQSSGNYGICFDGSGLPGGEYLYRLETAGQTQIRKMLLIR